MASSSVAFASGKAAGRIGIDTIVLSVTGLTAGAWYAVAVQRPDGIGGYRIQADPSGNSVSNYVPQMAGAHTFTVEPTNWTTGSVPQPGLPASTITTTTFNVVAVAPDAGMAFPTATVGGVTQAASTLQT